MNVVHETVINIAYIQIYRVDIWSKNNILILISNELIDLRFCSADSTTDFAILSDPDILYFDLSY